MIPRRALPHAVVRCVRRMSQSTDGRFMAAPLMGDKVLEYIQPVKDGVVLDMTFGSGGHTELILKSAPSVTVLALDRDPLSFAAAQKLSNKYPDRLIPLLGKFSDLPNLIEPLGYKAETIDAMLLHCGCSTFQIDDPKRGFTPLLEGPLDMRMDGGESETGPTAKDVLVSANEVDLKNIFKLYGCLSQGKKIAKAILLTRYTSSALVTTTDLTQLLLSECELTNQEVRSVFRSLRYFVNDELNEINFGLLLAEWYLKKGGRLLTISEAYLDDVIIKSHITGVESSNFARQLPMAYSSYTAPIESDIITKKSPWTKLNKHVIIPEGDKLLMKTSKLRAVAKN